MTKEKYNRVMDMNADRYKELAESGEFTPLEKVMREWELSYDAIKVRFDILDILGIEY